MTHRSAASSKKSATANQRRTSHEHGTTLSFDVCRDARTDVLNDADDITTEDGVGRTEESSVLPVI